MKRWLWTFALVSCAFVLLAMAQLPRPGEKLPASKVSTVGLPSTDLQTNLTNGEICQAPCSGGGGGHIIQDEGTGRPARAGLNFTGAGISCTDDSANNQTDCDVTGGGSTAFSAITSGTNPSATMTVGSGATINSTGTGTIIATQLNASSTILPSQVDGTDNAKCARFSAAGTLIAATGDCASGDTTGGTPAFSSITTGTNTTATMTVGTGASITTSGSGTISATTAENAYRRCVELEADDITCFDSDGTTPDGCTGATISNTTNSFTVADFQDSATVETSGSWSFTVPPGWTGGTATVEIDWMSTDAGCLNEATDTVCWTFDSGSVADQGAFANPTLAGAAGGIRDFCHGINELNHASFPAYTHGMTSGQRGIFVLTRDPVTPWIGDRTGGDAYAEKARLIGVRLCKE